MILREGRCHTACGHQTRRVPADFERTMSTLKRRAAFSPGPRSPHVLAFHEASRAFGWRCGDFSSWAAIELHHSRHNTAGRPHVRRVREGDAIMPFITGGDDVSQHFSTMIDAPDTPHKADLAPLIWRLTTRLSHAFKAPQQHEAWLSPREGADDLMGRLRSRAISPGVTLPRGRRWPMKPQARQVTQEASPHRHNF